ncbi:MAG: hypothetical protein IT330_12760 [Anaerolineae bacterium]|nr:hypothetical protein [Anaerolineae bacterium]
MTASSIALHAPAGSATANLWLRNRNWDLALITFSAVLIALPYTLFLVVSRSGVEEDTSRNLVNLVVSLFIGGPHMYATFTRTILDNDFRRQHPLIVASSILLPITVIILAVKAFIILLTIFFFWASIHVLHQIIYLIDCYNQKTPARLPLWSRLVDYGIVLTSLYPIAAYKLVRNEFQIGGNLIQVPAIFRHDWVVVLAVLAFAGTFLAFTAKTIWEFSQGRGHWPKTTLIYVTAIAAFFVPAFPNLDVGFQGFNTWHSLQYLALTWYANHLRQQQGRIHTPLISRISSGNDSTWRFYGFNVALTFGALVIVILLWIFRTPLSLSLDQIYYMTVLSFLLVHYYHDHVLFTQPQALVPAA